MFNGFYRSSHLPEQSQSGDVCADLVPEAGDGGGGRGGHGRDKGVERTPNLTTQDPEPVSKRFLFLTKQDGRRARQPLNAS